MKIIFLDKDGVVNSDRYFDEIKGKEVNDLEYDVDLKTIDLLEYAVKELLKAQRDDGRFSTYSEEKQFNGWDLWGRKYVLTGMMHFMRICKDESLKTQILDAICRHADYIVTHIGEGEGQKSILKTCNAELS